MTQPLSPVDAAKFAAAKRAAAIVENGMKVGLGTGSTAAWLVRCLAERMRDENITFTGVPTSSSTASLATELGIPITTLDDAGWLDLTIDGADEYDPELNLIKGGGGALLQEKIVATASDRMVVIADATKKVATLGAFPLPIEVIGFGMNTTKRLLESLIYMEQEFALGLDGLIDHEEILIGSDWRLSSPRRHAILMKKRAMRRRRRFL